MNIPDNYDAFRSHEDNDEKSHNKWINSLPECEECGKKILDEMCYEIGDMLFCEHCVENFKVHTSNYCTEE